MSIISKDIERAKAILCKDDVVAIPTETVYGLAGNIFSKTAIRRIFEVKQRPLYNPLIVHIGDIQQLDKIAKNVPERAKALAGRFWPGPLTLLLGKQPTIPDLVTAGKPTVAVRIPNHPKTLELLKDLPFPLAAPSANPFNRISPTTSTHVEEYFINDIDMVLEGGPCSQGIESTIVGFEGDETVLYRYGSISVEEIEEVVGSVRINNHNEKSPSTPGMLPKHYAPRTKTLLVDDADEFVAQNQGRSIGVLKFSGTAERKSNIHTEILSKAGDLSEAAANLYTALHTLDHLGLDIIVAQRFPNYSLGMSINDRLERAAN